MPYLCCTVVFCFVCILTIEHMFSWNLKRHCVERDHLFLRATHIQRNVASEFCAILFNGKFDDGPCSGWGAARPICEVRRVSLSKARLHTHTVSPDSPRRSTAAYSD